MNQSTSYLFCYFLYNNSVIVSSLVSTWYKFVTDGQTDSHVTHS